MAYSIDTRQIRAISMTKQMGRYTKGATMRAIEISRAFGIRRDEMARPCSILPTKPVEINKVYLNIPFNLCYKQLGLNLHNGTTSYSSKGCS